MRLRMSEKYTALSSDEAISYNLILGNRNIV
jgi:hypothetical protein